MAAPKAAGSRGLASLPAPFGRLEAAHSVFGMERLMDPCPNNGLEEPMAWEKPDVRTGQEFSGAGEGIRTLDPDLGKVVLYP